MAINVVTTGSNTQAKVVYSNNTIVKKVVVGTPVKRVTSGSFSISNLAGITTVGAVQGSVLVYNASDQRWEPTLTLEEQNVNGGQY